MIIDVYGIENTAQLILLFLLFMFEFIIKKGIKAY